MNAPIVASRQVCVPIVDRSNLEQMIVSAGTIKDGRTMVLDVNGIELNFEVVGEGEPLLWLHGYMGAGADWRFVFGDPPAGYRLIAPDLRGHGSSTTTPDQFTFRQAAADISALLEHLGLDAVKAIGVSGGGIALLHMATKAPSSIDAMVIVSAPPWFPAQARAIQRQTSAAMLGEAELEHMRKSHRHGAAQIDRLFAWARAFADSYDDVNFTPPYLSRITADTLIVFGDRDPFYPVSLAQELHAAIPRSHLWVVPNGGHAPVFGPHAKRFAETALSFLRGDWRQPLTPEDSDPNP